MAYAEDGYEVAALFEPGFVADLQQDVTEHIDRIARALHLPFAASEPGAPFADRLERIARNDQSLAELLRVAVCTDAHRGPRIAPLAEHPAIRERAEAMAGVKLDEAVMRLRANVPALSRRRHGWHSDVAVHDGTSCSKVRIACWLPLMDAGPDSGGLEMATGRRTGPLPHERERSFEIPDAEIEHLPKAHVDCPAGSAIFMDRFTPHRALPNTTDKARLAVVIWMKSAP